jgi:NAD kinase
VRKIKYIKSEDPRSKQFNDFVISNFAHLLKEDSPDFILVTGGDGAMLHAIQAFHHLKVPFVGHAAGTLNFLMNSIDNYDDAISKLLDSDYQPHIIETTSIKVDLHTVNNEIINLGFAVNEIVLGSDVMGYHTYTVSSEDGSLNNFTINGTGLSISTDLGSTGYNFNLGGPILPLGSNLWSIVGVVCNRYLNDILQIQKVTIKSDENNKGGTIFIDCINTNQELYNGAVVELSKGHSIKIAFLDKSEFIRKRVDITSRYRKS